MFTHTLLNDDDDILTFVDEVNDSEEAAGPAASCLVSRGLEAGRVAGAQGEGTVSFTRPLRFAFTLLCGHVAGERLHVRGRTCVNTEQQRRQLPGHTEAPPSRLP